MMIIHLWILFLLIKCSFSKTSVTNYPTVDLLENSPLNTIVIQLIRSDMKQSKLVLLNMAGFESNMFSIINGSIYTTNIIDREQFISEKRCFDRLYCVIELHILVDDGFAYWVIPIHIVDENDNKPEFAKSEIELKFRENVPNGYKIPFGGAMDFDEGPNGQIRYVLDCSTNSDQTLIDPSVQSSINCFPLFQLIILSQSSVHFDGLALKFVPSSSVNLQNEYKLVLYAIDNGHNGQQLNSSMNIIVKIERKEKAAKFSMSEYEFVVSINSSLSVGTILDRVYALPNDPSQVIHYKLFSLNNNQSNEMLNNIKINSLTGEIILLNENLTKTTDDIEFVVQASHSSREKSSKMLTSRAKVKILFRYSDLLNNVSYQLQTMSSTNRNKIHRLNNSDSFVVDQDVKNNEELLKLSVISLHYPLDKYILSLENYLTTFSLISSSMNSYMLKTCRHLTPKLTYMLNIGVKHKLSQQWMPNLRIELIVVDQWTTTTTISTETTMTAITTSILIESQNESSEVCVENRSYILRDENNEIGFLRVIETNSMNNISLFSTLVILVNQSEMIVDGCRMHIDRLDNPLNTSSQYQICSSILYECYNVTFNDQVHPMSMKSENDLRRWLLPRRPIEIAMFALSMIFIVAAITLLLLICRLKGIHLCLTMKNYLLYGKKYGLNNTPRLSTSKMTQRVHSIVIRESRSPSFEPIRIKNDIDEPYIFNIDHLLEREPLPSTNMFTLPPNVQVSSSLTSSLQREERTISIGEHRTTPRTSSSSSFLHETKQLLDMISSNQNLDSLRLASEV